MELREKISLIRSGITCMVQVPFCEIEIKVNRLGSGCNENDWFKQYSTSVHFKNPFVSHSAFGTLSMK